MYVVSLNVWDVGIDGREKQYKYKKFICPHSVDVRLCAREKEIVI